MEDRRAHRTLVADSGPKELQEFMGDLNPRAVPILNGYMLEAQEFYDEDMDDYCRRYIRLGTSVDGKRAELTADVAKHDDDLKDTPESRVPPKPKA